MNKLVKLMAVAGVMFLMGTTSGCGQQVPQASVGVKFDANSGVSTHVLKPEWVWINPMTERMVIYPTGTQSATFVMNSNEGRKGDDSIRGSTKEGASLPIDVTVVYRMGADKESVSKVWNNFGIPDHHPERPLRDIEDEHIYWATVAAVNDVSGNKGIFDLISKQRNLLGPEIKKILAPRMEDWGLILDDVLIGEVHPDQEITASINEQQGLVSDLDTTRNNLKTETLNAQTTVTNERRKAEQNRLLAQQGDVVLKNKKQELERIKWERWDGVAPIVGDGIFDAR